MSHGPVWAAAAFACLIGQTAVVLQASCEASVGDHLMVECTSRGPLISVTWFRRPFRSPGNDQTPPPPPPIQLAPDTEKWSPGDKPTKATSTSGPSPTTSVSAGAGLSSCCSLRLRRSDHFLLKGRDDRKLPSYSCLSFTPTDEDIIDPSHPITDTRNSVFMSEKRPEDYSVVTCQGANVTMICDARSSKTSPMTVNWKRLSKSDSPDVHLSQGDTLLLGDVQRVDGGSYACEVTSRDHKPSVVTRELLLIVEYPPVIFVPAREVRGSSSQECRLHCVVEAIPEARVTWYKDDIPLGNPEDTRFRTVSETSSNCTLHSTLLIHSTNDSNVSANDSNADEDTSPSFVSFGNYTCVAENKHGRSSAVLTLVAPDLWDLDHPPQEEVEERRFNVTGFIIGMMPPLFISFYIIVKLGYRSRYAQEHPEDDGGREEPFFVSY